MKMGRIRKVEGKKKEERRRGKGEGGWNRRGRCQ
jgi:hypothetical protein